MNKYYANLVVRSQIIFEYTYNVLECVISMTAERSRLTKAEYITIKFLFLIKISRLFKFVLHPFAYLEMTVQIDARYNITIYIPELFTDI